MRYYLDCEFIDDGKTVDLISIGIVDETDRTFYYCNREAALNRASDWVIWNVFPHLEVGNDGSGWRWLENPRKTEGGGWEPGATVVDKAEIRRRLVEFIGSDPAPVFVGYYAAYDFVAICQLFGRMEDLPDGFPLLCLDIVQEAAEKGVEELPAQLGKPHYALADAMWVKEASEMLSSTAYPLQEGVE